MDYKERRYLSRVAEMIQEVYGIQVPEAKMLALSSKTERLMRRHKIGSIQELYEQVSAHDHSPLYQEFLDVVTTHKTDFFRESNHFAFLIRNIGKIMNLPAVKENLEVRVWSAACSTGEEPYTLYMVLREHLPPDIRLRILATDISPGSLRVGMRGIYSHDAARAIEAPYRTRYFNKLDHHHVAVAEEMRESISFRQFNLLDPFPFKGKFEIVFCRNVMIYFSKELQAQIVRKMYDVVDNNGYFFIGLSEGLQMMKQDFRFVEPSVYQK